MNKTSIISVWQTLLSEDDKNAKIKASEYINESAARILKKLMEEDSVDVETSGISSDNGSDIVTVVYADPNGDCDFDDDIIYASNKDDYDSYGWSKGKRIISFLYNSPEEASQAAQQIGDLSDTIDDLEVSYNADSGSEDISGTEDTTSTDDGDITTDTETETTDETPETDDVDESSDDTVEVTDSEDDGDTSPEEIEIETDSTEQTISDTIDDIQATVDDRLADLKAELEAAGISIDIDGDEDATGFTDLEESFLGYEDVKIPVNKDLNDGKSPIISTPTKDRLKPASPIKSPAGKLNGDGTKAEPAPSVKDLPASKNTIKGNVEKTYSKVSKEGDASASINSKEGFGEEGKNSVID